MKKHTSKTSTSEINSDTNSSNSNYVSARYWILPTTITIGIIIVWEFWVKIFGIQEWLLPPPTAIFSEMFESKDLFLMHTLVTINEVVLGFMFALIVGIFLAGAISYSNLVERVAYPFVIASQTVPVIVIAPLLLIWIGYGILPKIIVVMLISFFPIVVNTVDGLKSADTEMMNMLRTLGASKQQQFFKVRVPYSIPFLFSGMRIAITLSVIGAVIGEWVGSSAGLGYLMMRSAPQFLTDRVFASIIILSIMGITLFFLVVLIEKLFVTRYQLEKR